MTGGSIVPAYNNPGCDLRVTQTELADIFLGNITTWEEVGCDGGIITVVHRSDGSGTEQRIYCNLCLYSLRNGEQKLEVVRRLYWPTGVGGKGNSGVVGVIRNTEGLIGYLNYGYVNGGQFQQASVQNRDGNFVQKHEHRDICYGSVTDCS